MKRYRKPLPEELNLIRKVVWSYVRSTGLEFDDLFSEACLAYLESLKNYDYSKSSISTYIYIVVNNALKNLLQKENKRRDTETVTAIEDFDKIIQEIEMSPEQHLLAEERWEELTASLSPEAMTVIDIINNGEVDINPDKPKLSRGTITKTLVDIGWKQNMIWRTFRELKKLVAATTVN